MTRQHLVFRSAILTSASSVEVEGRRTPAMTGEDPHRYSVAGLAIEFDSRLGESFCFQLPKPFEAFRLQNGNPDLQFAIFSQDSIPPQGDLIYETDLNWRIRRNDDGPIFESYHPASRRVLASAAAQDDFKKYEVLFDEGTLRWLWETSGSPMPRPLTLDLPYPFEQLLLLPVLAKADGFMVHACGAVLDGKALVFAGHSNDGKTTLSRLLAAEGLELLSDERIAIRKQEGVFVAHGTPWPGQGNVFSPAAYPLGGMYLLRKARRHRLIRQRSSTLAAELLSRSIVPYYFPEETARILELHHEIATAVPLRSLEFSLSPGLVPILSQDI